MSRAVLSIGSNLGDRLAHLQAVVDALGEHVVALSPVYATAPWGPVEQPDFLNAVVIADDPQTAPADWLTFAQRLEAQEHRVREVHWGPRSVDVDIIAVRDGDRDVLSDDPDLTIPHPRAFERAFVLVPWLDVDPDATLPVGGAAVPLAELLARIEPSEVAGVRRTTEELHR